ncbi:alpha/beta fold hydrolase [Nocardiopsis suaedae]|uniref:Alpha/beta hydrolase n=1 Tax=Nocardiopsis suaedae TaxID=3018444 RepID=A0ABT4TH99_9ACTN|nr:alpha/beta hydrolase [Nocardiopsis suaedae]MDA2804083.1 alpha/beta hydrolase [Nocardiopsis suaedae]
MDVAISRDGTRIAYDRRGSGPALILVDGALGHRAFNPHGAALAGLLQDAFTVYTYDRRGRGDSGDTAPYAVEREIEDLEALIRDAGGRAHLFGMSSGAVLALDAAAHGLAVEALALYEPPFIVDGSRPPLPPDYAVRVGALAAEGRRAEAVEYFMTAALGLPAELLGGMREDPSFARMEKVAHTLAYDAAVIGGTMSGVPLPPHRWASVTAPVLVADGGKSEHTFADGADALAAVLRDVRRATLDGQTHDVDPEVLAPVLRDFFAH